MEIGKTFLSYAKEKKKKTKWMEISILSIRQVHRVLSIVAKEFCNSTVTTCTYKRDLLTHTKETYLHIQKRFRWVSGS